MDVLFGHRDGMNPLPASAGWSSTRAWARFRGVEAEHAEERALIALADADLRPNAVAFGETSSRGMRIARPESAGHAGVVPARVVLDVACERRRGVDLDVDPALLGDLGVAQRACRLGSPPYARAAAAMAVSAPALAVASPPQAGQRFAYSTPAASAAASARFCS